jgi:hypothetical protein
MNNECNCGQLVTEKKQLFDNLPTTKKPLLRARAFAIYIMLLKIQLYLFQKLNFYSFTTLAACGPRAPSTISNSTC